MKGKIGTLVCDANILIDYFDNNKNVLRLATQYCYDIHVPIPVFREVHQMTDKDAEDLGISLFEPTIDQLFEASGDTSALSEEDCLCFIIARDKNWICATNEKRLRNKCEREKVRTIRGLKIMLDLHSRKKLEKDEAIATATRIKDGNSRITVETLKEFIDRIRFSSNSYP